MIAYHISRSEKDLIPETTLNLQTNYTFQQKIGRDIISTIFPNGLSQHGN